MPPVVLDGAGRRTICSAQRFAVLRFTIGYYDTFALAHDHVIGRLAKSVCALNTCMSGTRNMYMPIYGVMWQGVTHSRTHTHLAV